jgi:hypothetical protein
LKGWKGFEQEITESTENCCWKKNGRDEDGKDF